MLIPIENIDKEDAVLIIDVQKDYFHGGALEIDDADKIIPILNQWIETAFLKDIPVYLSRDWHPINHPSFKQYGGQWLPHCIQDTDGARFHPSLKRPENAIVVTKGTRFDVDQCSAFDRTGLGSRLSFDGIDKLWVGGVALDACVLHSVLDAMDEGFNVNVIGAGTRPMSEKDGLAAIKTMKTAGAVVV